MSEIDPNNPRQPYEQVADYLRNEIASGRLKPGDKLPSGRDLAKTFDIAIGTAMRGMNVLVDEGLTVSWQGRGAFVRDAVGSKIDPVNTDSDVAYVAIMSRLDEIQEEMQELSGRVSQLEQRRQQKAR